MTLVCLPIKSTVAFFILLSLGQLTKGMFDYSPGDTRLLDYTMFCEALTVGYTNAPVNIGPSVVYKLNSRPLLTDADYLNFSQTEVLNNSMRLYFWNLHFYENSTIEVVGCIDGNGTAQYYIIKGKKGFDDYKSTYQLNSAVVNSLRIETFSCAEEMYTVREEEQYFFVFQLTEGETISLNLSIKFNRTKYSVENRDSPKHYFNASTPCTVQTPLNRGNYFLLVYGDSTESPENWSTFDLDTSVKCKARVWLYVVVSVGPVLVLLMCVVCVVCCVCCVRRAKKRSPEGSPLLRNWDNETESINYYQYSDRSKRLDPLTELAIASPDHSNPHLAQFKEDLKSPSFEDRELVFGSPKFSTFK